MRSHVAAEIFLSDALPDSLMNQSCKSWLGFLAALDFCNTSRSNLLARLVTKTEYSAGVAGISCAGASIACTTLGSATGLVASSTDSVAIGSTEATAGVSGWGGGFGAAG